MLLDPPPAPLPSGLTLGPWGGSQPWRRAPSECTWLRTRHRLQQPVSLPLSSSRTHPWRASASTLINGQYVRGGAQSHMVWEIGVDGAQVMVHSYAVLTLGGLIPSRDSYLGRETSESSSISSRSTSLPDRPPPAEEARRGGGVKIRDRQSSQWRQQARSSSLPLNHARYWVYSKAKYFLWIPPPPDPGLTKHGGVGCWCHA